MSKITAIIPTYNEEPNIRGAIEAVNWADEIIVVDSFSTDKTPEIAGEYERVKLVQHEYENSASQKNWIIPQAAHDWIFLLDADERVRDSLKKEILKTARDPGKFHAFWIPRENFFFGRSVRHALKGDRVIRLFRRDTCRYQELAVHAEIETTYPVGELKNSLEHNSYRDSTHFLAKMERYAGWSARDHNDRTGHIGSWQLVVKPAFRFFKHYFLNRGFLDGRAGLIMSILMAWGVFLRYFKMIEMRRNKDFNKDS